MKKEDKILIVRDGFYPLLSMRGLSWSKPNLLFKNNNSNGFTVPDLRIGDITFAFYEDETEVIKDKKDAGGDGLFYSWKDISEISVPITNKTKEIGYEWTALFIEDLFVDSIRQAIREFLVNDEACLDVDSLFDDFCTEYSEFIKRARQIKLDAYEISVDDTEKVQEIRNNLEAIRDEARAVHEGAAVKLLGEKNHEYI